MNRTNNNRKISYKNIVSHNKLWSKYILQNSCAGIWRSVAIAIKMLHQIVCYSNICWKKVYYNVIRIKFVFVNFLLACNSCLYLFRIELLNFHAINAFNLLHRTYMHVVWFIRSFDCLPEHSLTRSVFFVVVVAFRFTVSVKFSFLEFSFFICDGCYSCYCCYDSISCHLFHSHVWFGFCYTCHFNWNLYTAHIPCLWLR